MLFAASHEAYRALLRLPATVDFFPPAPTCSRVPHRLRATQPEINDESVCIREGHVPPLQGRPPQWRCPRALLGPTPQAGAGLTTAQQNAARAAANTSLTLGLGVATRPCFSYLRRPLGGNVGGFPGPWLGPSPRSPPRVVFNRPLDEMTEASHGFRHRHPFAMQLPASFHEVCA